jgi:CRISPR-associated protein Csx17
VLLEPKISRLLVAGRLGDATRLAARRLTGSSLPVAVEMVPGSAAMARRIAAALLFPLAQHDLDQLAKSVLKPLPVTT